MLIVVILTLLAMVTAFDMDVEEPIDWGMGINFPQPQAKFGMSKNDLEGLQEFTPISATIGQSELQYYSFSVNTSAGLGQYYEFLIFLTGNICSQPANVKESDSSLAVYYSFNASMFKNLEIGEMQLFKNGYFQALSDVPSVSSKENQDPILYIAVRAPENTDKSSKWSYEIGVSQNDLVFQWDDRSWASLVDTDDSSALIVTGNLTDTSGNYSEYNASTSRYSLFIYSEDYKNYFNQLNSSWCAIRNGPALLNSENFASSFTSRSGGLQQQFYVGNLNSSTKYLAYLVSDFNGQRFGGAVYRAFEFETMDHDACNLIYDLEFCDKVAYAVPNNPKFSKQDLRQMYDDRASLIYQNFSKALQQIPCNTTRDSIFSPIINCDNCAQSYKDWLCAVTIPRCSTRDISGYVKRDIGENRNEWIDVEIQPYSPYYEVLPCLNVCHAIVRDCPADFGFLCPKHNVSVRQSYFWDEGDEFPTCNYIGDVFVATNGGMGKIINYGLIMAVFIVHWLAW